MYRQSVVIPPGCGRTMRVDRGGHFRVVNSEGGQVVDTWAFRRNDPGEYLSMAHCHSATYRIHFRPGDCLVTNRFNPMVTIISDTSPGLHDSLHGACSDASNAFYGAAAGGPSCEGNLKHCLFELGQSPGRLPDPWNLFEETTLAEDGSLADRAASAGKGDYVELRADMDLFVICSACPSLVGGINGDTPRGALMGIL